MNNKVTSKEEILEIAKKMIDENGMNSLSIRSLAKSCNMATGSLYNYFSSKNDLIIKVVTSFWHDFMDLDIKHKTSFNDAVIHLIQNISEGKKRHPNFFKLHSFIFDEKNKEEGRHLMKEYLETIKENMLYVLKEDTKIRKDAFDETFTQEMFIDIIFNLILSYLIQDMDSQYIYLLLDRYLY